MKNKNTKFLTGLGMSSILLMSAIHPTSTAFAAVEKSGDLKATYVKIENKKTGDTDSIQVSELEAGDKVRVYSTIKSTEILAEGTVENQGKSLTISKKDLLEAKGGTVYVTVTKKEKEESSRTAIKYTAEPVTKAPAVKMITVVNNKASVEDEVKVEGVKNGATVRVYDASSGGKELGKAIVKGDSELEIGIVKIKQIAKNAKTTGTVYVSVENVEELESPRTAVKYDTEVSAAPAAKAITVENNKKGAEDTIKVTDLTEGDIVKVYNVAKDGEVKATSEAVADGGKEATIKVKDLLESTGGTVYVTVTKPNKDESSRTAVKYATEPVTKAPAADTIAVANNKKAAEDTIKVTGLVAGDIVTVYDAATKGNTLATETVAKEKQEVEIKKADLLKATGGTVYVSVKGVDGLESSRTAVKYDTEVSAAPAAKAITVENNKKGAEDTIKVTDLTEGDIVKVYNVAKDGEVKATSEAVADGGKEATIKVKDLLESTGGTVYVTVTKPNKDESSRTAVKYATEPVTKAPAADTIAVANNKKAAEDTIKVTGLVAGDIVTVYDAATKGNTLATETVAKEKQEVEIKKADLLKATGGTVYVSVKGVDGLESSRTAVKYDTEVSAAPAAKTITVENNKTGAEDTIKVTDLTEGDIVKVYNVAKDGEAKATSEAVAEGGKEATIKVKDLLETTGGTVYVTVTKPNKDESSRTAVKYATEPVTKAPAADTIAVANNKKAAEDTIKVTGLVAGDIVTVYDAATKGNTLATETVAKEKQEVEIKKADLLKATGGTVYVSVKGVDGLESSRTAVKYDTEVSAAPAAKAITVENNKKGAEDTIKVTDLTEGDIVKVYNVAKDGEVKATSEAVADGGKEATIKVKDLLESTGGTVYVTVTKPNKDESSRTAVKYATEPVTKAPAADTIAVANNKKAAEDTIKVTGLVAGDIVTVYDAATKGNTLATETVAKEKQEVEIKKADLLKATGGTVYVSVKGVDGLESSRTAVKYDTEVSAAPAAKAITVENNKKGAEDTIKVTDLTEGDIVKVYNVAKDGEVKATSEAVADGGKEATIKVKDLLESTGGTVYVTVTKPNKDESSRTAVKYATEPVTKAPAADTIAVANNKKAAEDTIKVTGLVAGDIVTVYDAATKGNTLATETVAKEKQEVEIKKADLLKATGGTVYVSVKGVDGLESSRTAVKYDTEVSAAPAAKTITVENNKTGAEDTIKVTDLTEGDIVKVYNVAKDGEAKATSEAVAEGGKEATIKVKDLLETTGGTVYVTVTKPNKDESSRTAVKYTTEPVTKAPAADTIAVANNKKAAEDTIKVTGLVAGDIVTVYDAATKGNTLATETVAKEKQEVEIKKADLLKATGGTVYVSVKGVDGLESSRTAVKYDTEVSAAPAAKAITVENNKKGAEDTIKVTDLTEGDIVKVYNVAKDGEVKATSEAVADGGKEATIKVKDLLESTGGTVYVTVTKPNKDESSRTAVKYATEPVTKAPAADTIAVANNKKAAEDTIKVTGLVAGDIVTVYDAATKGNTLATETVAKEKQEVEIKKADLLKATGGTVYVSVKGVDGLESSRTAVKYDTEVSAAPAAKTITVENNKTGAEDTIKVTDLTEGDIVKVYNVAKDGEAKATSEAVAEGGKEATIKVKDLLETTGGTVYVTVTKPNKDESSRTAVKYTTEPVTKAPAADTIAVANNKKAAEDTIKVTGLVAGDIVTVYDAATKGNTLATETVAKEKQEVEIKKADLLKATGGTVYVSVKGVDGLESSRTAVKYDTEVSAAPAAKAITVENNKTGAEDTIKVTDLTEGDIVKVYNVAKDGEAKATSEAVAEGGKEATIKVKDLLETTGGTVYVTVTKPNKDESSRTAVKYTTEVSEALKANNIVVLNNDGEEDIVRVTGLATGDVINVYDAVTEGEKLGTETVGDKKTAVNIKIKQLGEQAGKVYVTVTKNNKLESARTAKDYIAE
ncbi:hypothetical protein KU891_08315 [Bacillus tropicus]|uniref:hypothetical protein n=2 Tax=Bacillus tropicus TaxID=2026188 RepID=UPI0020066E26|nr:hypothetical protein [Bacillus tropicus]UOK49038.1 hypothetical protein KU891_08315 [Bacillus tropicus]